MSIFLIGDSIRSSALILLCNNLVANSYNLVLISLNCSRSEFVKLLGDDVAYNWYLILFETILMLIGIVSMNRKSSSRLKILMKYWLFGFIVTTIFLEMLAVTSFAILLYERQAVDTFWRTKQDNMTEELAPFHFHLFVAILLICFFAFKLYTSVMMFLFGSNVANHAFYDENNDIERVAPRHDEQLIVPLPCPPPYDRPPRYSEVFKY